jgi:SH3-like domain-containing protein
MALARNLNRRKPKIKKFNFKKKWAYFAIGIVVVLVAIYGVLNLSRIVTGGSKKQELKYETGDRPLPQKISLWVVADGGLKLRETPDSKGKIIILIPNGTQLTAEEVRDDWYKVVYMDKTGWVSKNYITTQAPAEDPTKNWKSYQNKSFYYSLRYPIDWVAQDYGANPASESVSYVGFGPQLGAALDPNNVPPVIVRVTTKSAEAVEAGYKPMAGFVAEAATISSLPSKKCTFSSSSGVQITVYIVAKGSQTYIFEDTGGYSEELSKILASVILS